MTVHLPPSIPDQEPERGGVHNHGDYVRDPVDRRHAGAVPRYGLGATRAAAASDIKEREAPRAPLGPPLRTNTLARGRPAG